MIGKKFKTACELRFPSQDLLNKCGDKLKYLRKITSVILPKDTELTVVDYNKSKNKYIFQINFIGEIISYNYKEFLNSKQTKDFLYESDLFNLFRKIIVKGKDSFLLDMHNINRYKDSEAGNAFYQYLNSLNKTKFDWNILFNNKELNFIDSDFFYDFIWLLYVFDITENIHNLILELPKLYISDLYYNIKTKDTENIWTYLDEINE